jgi:hypothetical protein
VSVTFSVRGERIDWDSPDFGAFVNMNSRNANDVLNSRHGWHD